MDTLRLVEVAGDGALVLMTGDGRRFCLAVDEQVRSAVRRSRNGTHEPSTGGDRPGPREVQSRIRAGADAEQVAAQTGLDVDYVRRFEGPVLAERAHVADLGRATAVDRGGDPTLDLERVVLDVLTGEGYDVDDITWDSRRSDGTRWQVLAIWRTGTARTEATWSFDTATRSLEPVDTEAERLTGVERRRRLSAVRETVFDVERPATAAARGGTVELLDALARQRGRRPLAGDRTAAPPEPSYGDEQHAAQLPEAEQAAGSDPAPEAAAGDVEVVEQAAGRDGDHEAEPARATDGPADEPGTPDEAGTPDEPDVMAGSDGAGSDGEGLRVVGARPRPQPPRAQDQVSIEPDLLSDLQLDTPRAPRASGTVDPSARPAAAAGDRRSKRRRAAVPSWDEIVFGAKREGT